MSKPAFLSTLGVVTQREFKRSFWTRSTVITLATVLLIMLAMLIVPRILSPDSGEKTIAVTGASSSQAQELSTAANKVGVNLEVTNSETLPEEADALWSVSPQGPEGNALEVRKASEQNELSQSVDRIRLAYLDGQGESTSLEAPAISAVEQDENEAQLLVIAYFVVLVGFNLVVSNASLVAQRTIEEKGNRVIDILIPRFHLYGFIAGKVCGTGLAGVAQLLLLGVMAAGLLTVTGSSATVGLVLTVLPHAIIWYVLGFLFFGFLYAGLGSLLRSPAEGAALQAPLQLLNLGLFVVAIFALQDPSAPWVQSLVAIPPFSLVLGPIVSVVSGWTPTLVVGGILTAVAVAVVVLSFLGVRLYRWGIVNEDWRRLFRRRSSGQPAPADD